MDPQLGERVEGRAAGQDPYGSGLALAGSGTDKPVRLKQGDADGPPAGVGAERNRGEHVGLAGLEQGPRRGLGLGDVVETDPQLQAPGVLAWHWRWPGSRQGTAQARGQRLTAGGHLGGAAGREPDGGRRKPEASDSRRASTWVAVTPCGRSSCTPQPGPSRCTSETNGIRPPSFMALLILPMPDR